MRAVLLVGLLAAAAIAGCADPAPIVHEQDDFQADEDIEVTDTTGLIRGVVIDSTITPLEGATIEIVSQGLMTTSDARGEFVFSGLEAGTYFLDVSRIGFLSVQQGVEVTAGEEAPPIVRVQLAHDVTFNPYSTLIHHQGHYQCGTSVVVVCGAPAIIFDVFFGQEDPLGFDSSTETFYFEEGSTWIQTEMVWESTQSLSTELFLQREALDTGCEGDLWLDNTEGESPLRAQANETTLIDTDIGGPDCGIYHSLFSGGGVGVSLEQPFEWFISAFYGYTPPEDWWFIEDGEVPPPR